MHRIIFFWTGDDVAVPSLLVKSVRENFGGEFPVVQLTDHRTPKVEGVSDCKRLKLSPHLMVARLQAYASMLISAPTLYLDADMVVMRKFELPDIGLNEVGVTGRDIDFKMNWQFPREFPEFKGKSVSEVMPYLYSFIYVRTEALFHRQLNELKNMPRRFHEWYGDQVSLRKVLNRGRIIPREFDCGVYNKTVDSLIDYEDACLAASKVSILHFKGKANKELLRYVQEKYK